MWSLSKRSLFWQLRTTIIILIVTLQLRVTRGSDMFIVWLIVDLQEVPQVLQVHLQTVEQLHGKVPTAAPAAPEFFSVKNLLSTNCPDPYLQFPNHHLNIFSVDAFITWLFLDCETWCWFSWSRARVRAVGRMPRFCRRATLPATLASNSTQNSNTQIHTIQIHKYTNTHNSNAQNLNTTVNHLACKQASYYTQNTQIQITNYTITQTHKYTNTPIHQYTSVT